MFYFEYIIIRIEKQDFKLSFYDLKYILNTRHFCLNCLHIKHYVALAQNPEITNIFSHKIVVIWVYY